MRRIATRPTAAARRPAAALGLIAAAALAAAMAMAAAAPARAHGEYDWIRQDGWRSRDGVPCCGVDDCFRMSADDVTVRGGRYHLLPLGLAFPMSRTLPSRDRYFWACVDEWEVRCFFAPPDAMSGRGRPAARTGPGGVPR